MKIVAVTGGIGSGKSMASREFERLGAYVIDADKISHEIMMKNGAAYNEVIEAFGNGILRTDGEIDRMALGDIVFADSKKLKRLTDITHRIIYSEIERRIEKADAEIICLEIPLLFTSECPVHIDMTVAVLADSEVRIARVMERDGCTREQVEARMKKQLSDEEMCRRADCTVENSHGIEELRAQVKKIFKTLIYSERRQ